MNNRNRLIQIIHVAKRQLALEDDVYRMLLESTTGKTSCSKMSIKQLEQVLAELENKGFKRQLKVRKTQFNKRLSPKAKGARTTVDKIRAIWITMGKQGFVRDGSETALDAYVRRITNRNKNLGVDHVAWCNEAQAYTVIESLKSWHRRVMIDVMKERGWTVPINERTGKPVGYDAIAEHYDWLLSVRKEVE